MTFQILDEHNCSRFRDRGSDFRRRRLVLCERSENIRRGSEDEGARDG